MLTSMLCAVRLSFYTSLVVNTLGLTATVCCIYIAYRWKLYHAQPAAGHSQLRNDALFVAVYLLVFAYPVLSVKIVEAFACHVVEDTSWLRIDYSIQCYTSQWYAMAMYASVYLVAYVVGLPIFIFCTLWSYRGKIAAAAEAHGLDRLCKQAPPGLLRGFLLDDYRLKLPCYLWEAEEITRKLLLSIIGSFFASKSVISIACALVLSLMFQLLHSVFRPFKQQACNRLQQICLSVLNLLYLAGLLLKTNTTSASDEKDLGVLLVVLLVTTLVAIVVGMVLEIRELVHGLKRTRQLTKVLRSLPQEDPPDNTPEVRVRTRYGAKHLIATACDCL
jgi:hypothetical protein